ncbi:MAG: type VII toxin-antitoxin system HepT family RNase toxin [Gemmatimonadota bacterium]
MVLKREVVERRLKELDRVLAELRRHPVESLDEYRRDLSRQWILERGLIAAAGIVLDVADHILSGHFGDHPDTYEASLRGLRDRWVISEGLYEGIEGLGGLRNILVHRYLDIDSDEVVAHRARLLELMPRFASEVLSWIEGETTAG